MKITADTNILVRGVVRDDENQALIVDKIFDKATLIAVSLACLCEFVWVLRKVYRFDTTDIYAAISALAQVEKTVMNRPAVEAGLAVLNAGGDFADGAIAYEGSWLGGETFVSFDKNAVALLSAQGQLTRLV